MKTPLLVFAVALFVAGILFSLSRPALAELETSTAQVPAISLQPAPQAISQATKATPALAPKPAPKALSVASRRTLRLGMRGEDVRQLQLRLTALKYSPGKADGYFSGQTYHAVVAFQKVNGLPRDGVAGLKTLQALDKPKTITVRHRGNHIEVNKALQVLLVVKRGQAVKIITASTGKRGFSTPTVRSKVYRKPGYRYWSRKYGGLMIWSSFFYGGVAVHGYSSVPPYPASHGCVRVPIADSKYVYDNMPLGSLVYVY